MTLTLQTRSGVTVSNLIDHLDSAYQNYCWRCRAKQWWFNVLTPDQRAALSTPALLGSGSDGTRLGYYSVITGDTRP